MSVWFAIPSKRPVEECEPVLSLWKERGYKIALWRDPDDKFPDLWDCLVRKPYPGYSQSVNGLVKEILHRDWKAEWIVTGGDDIEPDPNHTAQEIADQCRDHFGSTLGVMQPTGDRWGEDSPDNKTYYPNEPAYIDRVCGSPWMGRELCVRLNQGRGPMWPDYWHQFNDEEMQCVVKKLGIFWQRRDLIHRHNHWMKNGQMPTFLTRANSQDNWNKMRAIFHSRKASGFPGHELLPMEVA